MKRFGLVEFLSKLGYDYRLDKKFVRELCGMTKCRTNPNENIGFESCFLFLALCGYMPPLFRFLEFGTGRGTTSFLVSQQAYCSHILTLDIVDFNTKRDTWFEYQSVYMSNRDIHDKLVERFGPPKCPIARYNGDSRHFPDTCTFNHSKCDLVYIDGSHDYEVVKSDIELSIEATYPDSIIVLDDYHPNYGVMNAVHEMLPWDEIYLVGVNGHIFGPNPEKGTGHIIWPRGKYKDLFNESIFV